MGIAERKYIGRSQITNKSRAMPNGHCGGKVYATKSVLHGDKLLKPAVAVKHQDIDYLL